MKHLRTVMVLILAVVYTGFSSTNQQSMPLIIEKYSEGENLNEKQFLRLYHDFSCIGHSSQIVHKSRYIQNVDVGMKPDYNVQNFSCLTPIELFKMYEVNFEITEPVLEKMLPSMVVNIQQCRNISEPSPIRRGKRPALGVVWGYGIGFAILIFIISNLGAFLAPFMGVKLFDQILMFLVSMAVGTLTATALLILIPEALDLMAYEELNETYIAKMSTVCGALLFFFLSERMIKFLAKRRKKYKTDEIIVSVVDPGESLIPSSGDSTEESGEVTPTKNHHGHSHGLTLPEDGSQPSVSTVAYMIVVGDGLHKFVDGLSVGAAFSDNLLTGMTVGLSMICEEIAHEIGDIAMLLHAGLSIKRALLYNSIAAIFCFVGVAVGIILGETTSANQWIFALAAGIFLYVALVDMLPEMSMAAELAIEKHSSPFFITLFQTFGLVIGFFVILLVAMYVGDIQL